MSKKQSSLIVPTEHIEQCIYVIRGNKVMLDVNLAELYEVETGAFNRAVQRNTERFPEDFAFQLTQQEWESLRCQFGISNEGRGGRRYLPYAFTEQGVAMLSGVLRSPQAVMVNVEIMRTFVRMRHIMVSQVQISKELAELKSFLLKHTNSSDREFRRIWQAIEKLSAPPPREERRIGFDLGQ